MKTIESVGVSFRIKRIKVDTSSGQEAAMAFYDKNNWTEVSITLGSIKDFEYDNFVGFQSLPNRNNSWIEDSYILERSGILILAQNKTRPLNL